MSSRVTGRWPGSAPPKLSKSLLIDEPTIRPGSTGAQEIIEIASRLRPQHRSVILEDGNNGLLNGTLGAMCPVAVSFPSAGNESTMASPARKRSTIRGSTYEDFAMAGVLPRYPATSRITRATACLRCVGVRTAVDTASPTAPSAVAQRGGTPDSLR